MSSSMITIARKSYFSCGLQRKNTGNTGINYCFEVYLKGNIDPVTGLVINLTEVKKVLNKVKDQLDQKHLNFDLKLNHVEIADIHSFIHKLFKNQFSRFPCKEIEFLKSILYEGKFLSSQIVTD